MVRRNNMYSNNFFYYTSTDTATKILTSGEIWATNVRFMNDSEEFTNGLSEISSLTNDNMIKECSKDLTSLDYIKFYTISFCRREDALSQWFMYAKESGVSLEMDFADYGKNATYQLGKNEFVESANQIIGNINLQEIIYCTSYSESMPEKKKKEAQNDIKKLLEKKCTDNKSRSVTLSGVIESALLIKRYEFFQENEFRTIINVSNLPFDDNNFIFYRIDDNVVKSYVKVKCCMAKKFTGWPITAITIGPGFNQDVVFDSMKLFLDTAVLCIPEVSHEHYIERLKKYFYNAANKMNISDDKIKFTNYVSSHKWTFANELDGNAFKYQMHQCIVDFIEFIKNNSDLSKESIDTLDKYITRNYFSMSSIVLKKSTIPYIF